MKAAVIIFHKNVDNYVRPEWLKKCYDTIRNQTYKDFDVFELDYGGTHRQTYEGSIFMSEAMPTHAHAQNYLLDGVFGEDYDCCFNVNIDDYYALGRFENQLKYIEQGYDVVSSNFYRFYGDGAWQSLEFHNKDIQHEAFQRNHNIIAHPVVCYARKFWEAGDKLNPAEIPADDFALWKRSYQRGARFIISPDFLLWQRIHENNVSKR